jgi:hypothetical protein
MKWKCKGPLVRPDLIFASRILGGAMRIAAQVRNPKFKLRHAPSARNVRKIVKFTLDR